MADLINSLNRTYSVEPRGVRCFYGVANCWHGIIEKTSCLQNGLMGPKTLISVEVKSITDLMSRYGQNSPRR